MPTDLWSFALTCYARPGVEQACLHLQTGGADVCLLLCARWLEQRHIACNAQRLTQLRAIAAPWQHQVVQPLRRLRQEWKSAAQLDPPLARLREQIRTLELDAERELLGRLEHASRTWQAAESPATWLEQLLDCRDACRSLRAAAGQA